MLYISESLVHGDPAVMQDIANKALRRNSACGVTGFLYYDSHVFVQTLEGMVSDVDAIYESIQRDPRHRRLRLLQEESVNARLFGGWAMGLYNGAEAVGPLSRAFRRDLLDSASAADAPRLMRFLYDLSLGREDVYLAASTASEA